MIPMARKVAIGIQDFGNIIENNYFYIDKTRFISEWWNSGDAVTLITRPRRFGKTLNLSMLEYFFSNKYEGRGDLFEGLDIWKDEVFRKLQGTYPVIFLSFAGVKQTTYEKIKKIINLLIQKTFNQYEWLIRDDSFTKADKDFFHQVSDEMDDATAAMSLNMLCEWLSRHYGKKCIVLLDEYDTPMQEAYVNGYCDELAKYTRALFNNTFKTNPSLERAIMTGITRVSKESIFSDLNNLNVITTTSNEYAISFGFTEGEVFAAMDEQGIPQPEKQKVKSWYDGFTFGRMTDIYNPWSIISFLAKRQYGAHWANTSGNSLVSKLLKESSRKVKMDFEELLKGNCIKAEIDEQIVFSQLNRKRNAIWSLLLAVGYLKVVEKKNIWAMNEGQASTTVYRLALTNLEVKVMFRDMILEWFDNEDSFGDFVSAMFTGNVREMNRYMNEVALATFSYFDAGKHPSGKKEPERFYHGFVLGLLVDKAGSNMVKTNRESGYGRYDVVMEPRNVDDVAVIMEFKVFDPEDEEKELADTADAALRQIEEKKYDTDLLQRGIPAERIYKYGFAFEGERSLIKKG